MTSDSENKQKNKRMLYIARMCIENLELGKKMIKQLKLKWT